jgi:hypothetical protein
VAAPAAGPAPPPRAPRAAPLLGTLFILALLGAAGWFWWSELQGRWFFSPRQWGAVEEGRIYRSGQIHWRVVEDALARHGIRVIVDLAIDEPGDRNAAAECEVADRLGIRKVDVHGLGGHGTGPVEAYADALATIRQARAAGEPVLVHCAAGAQRTGGAVAFHRLLFDGWDGRRTYEEMAAFRGRPKGVDPLFDYVNENLRALAERLVERGLLPAVPSPLPRLERGE